MKANSISISGVLTMNLHSLNNEGAEGNYMQTRQVQIVNTEGKLHTVNAISGDMFKHIQGDYLLDIAKEEELNLCAGCQRSDANRIVVDQEFADGFEKEAPNSEVLDEAIKRCTIDDIQGILITSEIGGKKRAIGRKSAVEFGWIVGRPEATQTDSYFHVKYAPEGRGKGAGEQTGSGNTGQNIFHRPASSGQYAVVLNLDLCRVGFNDILMSYAIDESERTRRIQALLQSVLYTFIKPTGAMRNTQNPHLIDFSGVIAISSSTIPAPMISPLNAEYIDGISRIAKTLNDLKPESITLQQFASLAEFTEKFGALVRTVEPTGSNK